MSIDTSINKVDTCLVDSATTHTILKDKKYFSYSVKRETNVSAIYGTLGIIEGFGRANVLFSSIEFLQVLQELCNK
jgi:hypothetical protein